MIHSLTTFLAQAATTPPAGTSIFGNPAVMIVVMIVMFYFLLIRPQQRQRKEMEARLTALKVGDKVITTSGIHALVHNIKDTSVVLKVADSTMVEFEKSAIAHVAKKDA